MKGEWDYILFMVVLTLLTVFGNGITVVLILSKKVLRGVGNCLLANLAFVDFTTGLLLLPSNLYSAYVGTWPLSDRWCTAYAYIATLSYNISYTLLAIISLDAYFAVNHPFKYRYLANKTKLSLLLLLVWGSIIAYSLPMSIANETVHFRELHVCVVMASPLKQFNKSFLISQYSLRALLLVTVIVSYSLMFKKVQKHIKMRHKCNRLQDQRRTQTAYKAAFTMFMVISLFFVSWMPSALLEMANYVAHELDIEFPMTLFLMKVCFNTHYLSPAINPIIYAARKEQFRNQLKMSTAPFFHGTLKFLRINKQSFQTTESGIATTTQRRKRGGDGQDVDNVVTTTQT